MEFLSAVGCDLRASMRVWVRTPLFALLVTAGFGLAIGANAAVFSVTEAVFLAEDMFTDPASLVRVGEHPVAWREGRSISFPAYEDVARLQGLISQAGALAEDTFSLRVGGERVEVDGGRATADLFSTVGVAPLLGSTQRWGMRPDQVILGHSAWSGLFGGDPEVIGRTITIEGLPYDVVAVMPAKFSFTRFGRMWVPFDVAQRTPDRASRSLLAWVRLADGRTATELDAALAVLGTRLADAYPASNAGWTLGAYLRDDSGRANLAAIPLVMQPLMAMVLFVAAANGAGFVVASSVARRGEFATRIALGAPRARLVRLVFAENVSLVGAGGVAGAVLFLWLAPALTASLPLGALPQWLHPEFSLRVIAFIALATVMVGLVFAALPAAAIPRLPPMSGLQDGAAGITADKASSRSRRLLVIVQIAVTALLVGLTGNFATSYRNVVQLETGYRPDRVLAISYALPGDTYRDEQRRAHFASQVLEQVGSLGGSAIAAAFYQGRIDREKLGLPTDPADDFLPLTIASLGVVDEHYHWARSFRVVSPGFFHVMGLPIRGSGFSDAAPAKAPLSVIVSQGFANEYWGSRDPIGDRFRLGTTDRWFTISAVAGDVVKTTMVRDGILVEARPTVYLSDRQAGLVRLTGQLLVGPSHAPGRLGAVVAATLTEIEPEGTFVPLGRLDEIDPTRVVLGWAMRFCIALAGLATTLASLGLAATVAFAVQRRTQEVGIRIALGATYRDVLGLIGGEGMRLAYVGVAVGTLIGVPISRILRPLSIGSAVDETMSLLVAAVLCLIVAYVASYLPARRALRVDVVKALRAE